jgi:hypothetical protein
MTTEQRSSIDYAELSWVADLRKLLNIDSEKYFGMVVAFVEDRMDDSYKQGLKDGKEDSK